jgi:hypothetical protein
MVDRRDGVGHPASEDHSVEFDLAQLLGAFLAERRDDSGTDLIGRAAQEIFDLSAARLQDVVRLSKYPLLFPRDWLPLDVALAVHLVSAPLLQELRPVSPQLDARPSDVKSDVQLLTVAPMELRQVAPELQSQKRSQALMWFPPEPAREQPVLLAFHAEVQQPARPVSPSLEQTPVQVSEPQPEPGAQSSLSPPRSSQPPPLLLLQPDRGNVFALARRVRYQSNSSASSFL